MFSMAQPETFVKSTARCLHNCLDDDDNGSVSTCTSTTVEYVVATAMATTITATRITPTPAYPGTINSYHHDSGCNTSTAYRGVAPICTRITCMMCTRIHSNPKARQTSICTSVFPSSHPVTGSKCFSNPVSVLNRFQWGSQDNRGEFVEERASIAY